LTYLCSSHQRDSTEAACNLLIHGLEDNTRIDASAFLLLHCPSYGMTLGASSLVSSARI